MKMKLKRILIFTLVFIFQIQLNAQTEIESTNAPIYDSLSSFMDANGNSVIWDLQGLNFSNYLKMESDSDLVADVSPVQFRTEHPLFHIGDSLFCNLQDRNYPQNGSNETKSGSYTAECKAVGILKLPTETFNNIFMIKITENDQVEDSINSFCLKYRKSFSYFFSPEILQPILCYSEKIKKTCDDINSEYYKEISRPAMDSTNSVENLSSLISLINLNCTPNPANTFSLISYNLPSSGNVKLTLENYVNNVYIPIEDTHKSAGSYNNNVNLNGLMPGIYYVKLYYQSSAFIKQLIIN